VHGQFPTVTTDVSSEQGINNFKHVGINMIDVLKLTNGKGSGKAKNQASGGFIFQKLAVVNFTRNFVLMRDNVRKDHVYCISLDLLTYLGSLHQPPVLKLEFQCIFFHLQYLTCSWRLIQKLQKLSDIICKES